ncbi:hypothetical protein VBJFXLJN_CDS_0058 [Pseudomonas phage TIVP-H6]
MGPCIARNKGGQGLSGAAKQPRVAYNTRSRG